MNSKYLLYFGMLSILYVFIPVPHHLSLLKAILYAIFTFLYMTYIMTRKPFRSTKEAEEHQLSTLINSMVDFVCFKDGEGRWLQTNQFGLKLFQLEHVDYRGKTDRELAEYTEFYRDALIFCQEHSDRIAWENRGITRCEEVIPMPDGGSKTFDTIKHPLFHKDGSRKALVVIGRDITEKKTAEEQLLRSEKLSVIGELAASVAHEIRNPLTSLKGFVQFIRPTDPKNDQYYEIMINELERINQIVSELLLLAKPQKVHFRRVGLNETISVVISLLETQARMTNVQLVFREHTQIMLNCEQNQIKQLLINLIKNSIEASNHGGMVEIQVDKTSDNEAIIKIKDNGVGIDKEELTRLGEPFYSSKDKGTGLGLTVSYKIIEQHKGKISFESEKGAGTEVTIILPTQHANVIPLPLTTAN